MDSVDRVLSLNDRILLTEWILLALAGTDPKAQRDQMLRARLVMPSGRGITLRGYRAHVSDIVYRYRQGRTLEEATGPEVMCFLANCRTPLNAAAKDLHDALVRQIDHPDTEIRERALFDSLKAVCLAHPGARQVRRLITEEVQWKNHANGQAA